MNKTFVLSDETLNCYGFKVCTKGINLEAFKANPVMFYNHSRELGVIGRWENIKVKGSQLLADPVFDESDEFAMKIKNKVENGFLKSASIGIFSQDEYELKDNEKWLMKSVMKECSIVDIPANENALVLYDEHDRQIADVNGYFLSLSNTLNNTTNTVFLEQLAKILCVKDVTEENILKEAKGIMDELNPKGVKNRLDKALQMGIIDQQQFCGLLDMGNTNPEAFDTYFSKVEENHKAELQQKFEQYFTDHPKKIILPKDRNYFRRLAEMNYGMFLTVMEYIPDTVKLSDLLVASRKKAGNKGNWTLKEYRKFAPDMLRRDPELYQRLLEGERENNKQ